MCAELGDLLEKYSDFDEIIDVAVDIAAELDMSGGDDFADLRREVILKLKKLEEGEDLGDFMGKCDKNGGFGLKSGVDEEIGVFLVRKICDGSFDEIDRIKEMSGFDEKIWNIKTKHPILSRIYDVFMRWKEEKDSLAKKRYEDVMRVLLSCLVEN